MLQFHADILENVAVSLKRNTLVIMARGLGLERVEYAMIEASSSVNNLVFLLNYTDDQISSFYNTFSIFQLSSPTFKFSIIPISSSQKSRLSIYKQGGIVAVSARMLLGDLLLDKIPSFLISGIILGNIHTLSENSNEAFICHLFHLYNKEGFIQGFSDAPQVINRGFYGLQKTMDFFYFNHVIFLPRYHTSVKNTLDVSNLQVTEIHPSLTPLMKQLQSALFQLLEKCLVEFIKSCPLLETDFITLEESLYSHFDSILQTWLDPVWHKMTSKTKSLLQEIKTLRHLLLDLVRLDPISYLRVLDAILLTQQNLHEPAYWLHSDMASLVFKLAQDRVKSVDSIDQHPKWSSFKSLIHSIQKNEDATISDQNSHPTIHRPSKGESFNILVMVKDRNEIPVLNALLSGNEKDYLATMFNHYDTLKQSSKKPTLNSHRMRLKRKAENSAETTAIEESETNDTNPETDAVWTFFLDSKKHLNFEWFENSFIQFQTYSENAIDILEATNPTHVVLYDISLSFIRSLEVYAALRSNQALNSSMSLNIFLIMAEESIEEQKFLLEIRKEKEAFEKLEQTSLIKRLEEPVESVHRSRIVVDWRELRSALPFQLYKNNFYPLPRTLIIGDYLLTSDICVERKSIPDLISSFTDGRMYHQLTALCTAYKRPYLLLELDPKKSIIAQLSNRDLNVNISYNELSAKMTLMLLHFKNLRLLWSIHPTETTRLFSDLQNGQEPPSLEGFEEDIELTLLDGIPDLSLGFYNELKKHYKSMTDVLQSNKDELQKVCGVTCGQYLYDLFH